MDQENHEQDEIDPNPGPQWIRPDAVSAPAPQARPEALPFETRELGLDVIVPARIVEVLLTDWPRLSKNVATRQSLGRLVIILLLVSAAAALPYGAVLESSRFWRISLLFTGSLSICFPSLFIFSAYLGCRVGFTQNLVLSLLITSVAAIFTFGFFPILWFLNVTMIDETSLIGTTEISSALLGIALLAGIVHLMRCMFADTSLSPRGSYSSLILLWMGLLVFITIRMAITLQIL